MPNVHIFEVSDDEYFAATTAAEAVECAVHEWGQESYDETTEDFGAPVELADDGLAEISYNDDGVRKNFRSKLDELIATGETFPTYFASGNL